MRALLLIALLTVISVSCKPGTSPPADEGTMTGRVIPFDVNGDSVSISRDGTTVWLEGTDYRTVSDSSGHWTINNAPAGIYTVLFTRPGFDTAGYDHQRFTGSGTYFIDDIHVVKVPTDIAVLDYAVDTIYGGLLSLVYHGHLTSNKSQEFSAFCSNNSTQRGNPVTSDMFVAGPSFYGIVSGGYDTLSRQWFSFQKGQKVYLSIELNPSGGYPFSFGHGHDYSNTLEVTIQ